MTVVKNKNKENKINLPCRVLNSSLSKFDNAGDLIGLILTGLIFVWWTLCNAKGLESGHFDRGVCGLPIKCVLAVILLLVIGLKGLPGIGLKLTGLTITGLESWVVVILELVVIEFGQYVTNDGTIVGPGVLGLGVLLCVGVNAFGEQGLIIDNGLFGGIEELAVLKCAGDGDGLTISGLVICEMGDRAGLEWTPTGLTPAGLVVIELIFDGVFDASSIFDDNPDSVGKQRPLREIRVEIKSKHGTTSLFSGAFAADSCDSCDFDLVNGNETGSKAALWPIVWCFLCGGGVDGNLCFSFITDAETYQKFK